MENIILFTKSYEGDVRRVLKLKNSIEKYNVDNIPYYVSCPKKDKNLFQEVLGTKDYTLVNDEDIYDAKYPFDGWRSQQVIKSNVHRLKVTKNYLSIDSDSYFIRDFYKSDFIAKEDIPYTIIHENKEIQQYKKLFYNSSFSKGAYKNTLNVYREIFGSEYKKLYDYGPNPYIWSCKVWNHFEEHYLKPNNLTYESFNATLETQYKVQPREALIYAEYLLNTKLFEIIPTGPFFKVYHWKEMVDFEKKNNLFDEDILKESYLGIIYQSNMDKNSDANGYDEKFLVKLYKNNEY